MALTIFSAANEAEGTAQSRERAADYSLFREAARVIDKNAVFADGEIRWNGNARESIRTYLHERDAYSDYLTREEYSRFKEIQGNSYIGIGMEIEKARDGGIICFPLRSGPAWKAGVLPGDRLEKIGNVPVLGKSLFAVADMTRGKEGSRVDLTVRSEKGKAKRLTAIRSRITWGNVSKQRRGRFLLIWINGFDNDTKRDLEKALKGSSANTPLVIDLRGNRGGNLIAAIDSAELFLPKDATVFGIKTRSAAKFYRTFDRGPYALSPVYIWQDGKTASSAEVFTAALTNNGRAVSIGARSYGKGSRQDVIPLEDGSALVLTTGYLKTPAGELFNGRGLAPTYPLDAKSPGHAGYWIMTKKLFHNQESKR